MERHDLEGVEEAHARHRMAEVVLAQRRADMLGCIASWLRSRGIKRAYWRGQARIAIYDYRYSVQRVATTWQMYVRELHK